MWKWNADFSISSWSIYTSAWSQSDVVKRNTSLTIERSSGWVRHAREMATPSCRRCRVGECHTHRWSSDSNSAASRHRPSDWEHRVDPLWQPYSRLAVRDYEATLVISAREIPDCSSNLQGSNSREIGKEHCLRGIFTCAIHVYTRF